MELFWRCGIYFLFWMELFWRCGIYFLFWMELFWRCGVYFPIFLLHPKQKIYTTPSEQFHNPKQKTKETEVNIDTPNTHTDDSSDCKLLCSVNKVTMIWSIGLVSCIMVTIHLPIQSGGARSFLDFFPTITAVICMCIRCIYVNLCFFGFLFWIMDLFWRCGIYFLFWMELFWRCGIYFLFWMELFWRCGIYFLFWMELFWRCGVYFPIFLLYFIYFPYFVQVLLVIVPRLSLKF
jgi:hypothetical protein